MSPTTKSAIPAIFEHVSQFLRSAVPPCQLTIDTPTHIEVKSIVDDKEYLFGYCVMHQNSVTLGFNEEITEEDMKQLYPDTLIRRMNDHRRIDIHHWDPEIRQDIQDACSKLMYYFDEKGWSKV